MVRMEELKRGREGVQVRVKDPEIKKRLRSKCSN